MAKKTADQSSNETQNTAASEIARAIIQATEAVNGPRKKTTITRKHGGPFAAKEGTVKPKLKRKTYEHGIEVRPATCTPEEIIALNTLRPGKYCDGIVTVTRRKDKGIDR